MTTPSTLVTTNQTVAITEVASVVVTEVVQVSDQYVREIRVFGSPDGEASAPIFVLRLAAGDADLVELTTPSLKF